MYIVFKKCLPEMTRKDTHANKNAYETLPESQSRTRQSMYTVCTNVNLRRIRVTIVAMEKEKY